MSAAVATKTRYTPEDLLAMPDGKSYELVGGQLVERNMGAESSWVGIQLAATLARFGKEHGVGWTFGADCGYLCFPHAPGLVRKPDVSFVRYGRFPDEILPDGWVNIPPDLAVEVVSPNDTTYKLDEKLEDYRKAGVRLIWVINPKSRVVKVYRADDTAVILHENDELSGEQIIPGFRCPIRDILPAPHPSQEPEPSPRTPNGPG
jgi:Uma2 family endonuclease